MKLILILAAALALLFASCKTQDFATPTENEQLLGLNHEEEGLLVQLEAGDDVTAELADVRARRKVIEDRIAKRAVSGWMSWLPIGLPEPVKEMLAGGIGLLAFPRPRDNFKKGLKAIGKMDWKTAALAPFRMFGLAHTNDDPLDVLRGAAAAAHAKGNAALAASIDAEIARAVVSANVVYTGE